MAKLKPRRTRPGASRGAPAEDVPLHEGPQPDPADTEAWVRWRQVRHARFGREVGGPNDPRRLLKDSWK
jgi:hypothetical protein